MHRIIFFKKILLPSLCLAFSINYSLAQQADTVRLYYHINESTAIRQMARLDSILSANKNIIKSVSLIGYADFTGSTDHNLKLSLSRADHVKQYLTKNLEELPVTCKGKGELPGTELQNNIGVPKDRRVDMIIIKKDEVKKNVAATISKPLAATDSVTKPTAEEKINTLADLKPGESVDIQEFLFQPGRHYPVPESEKYITMLFNLLKKNKKLRIELIGHICCDYTSKDGFDNDTRDFALSLNRAKFIYVSLLRLGIPEARMKYTGFGSTKPKVYPEISDNDKAMNRRVEILILSN